MSGAQVLVPPPHPCTLLVLLSPERSSRGPRSHTAQEGTCPRLAGAGVLKAWEAAEGDTSLGPRGAMEEGYLVRCAFWMDPLLAHVEDSLVSRSGVGRQAPRPGAEGPSWASRVRHQAGGLAMGHG